MLRSPTVFEDVVKTVCTTNCAWSATVRMVDALVTHLGEPALGGDGPLSNAFPSPAAMAAAPESFYRDVVRAGYRGAYLTGSRGAVAGGELDLEGFATATPADASRCRARGRAPRAPRRGSVRGGAHHDDARPALPADPGFVDQAEVHAAGRPEEGRSPIVQIERRFRRYGEFAGLAFWLFVTRDWVEDGPA